MNTIDLNGRWNYERLGGDERGVGLVPGDVYKDLLDNRQIADPFYRDNEERLLWIGESDWRYQRNFVVSQSLLKHDRLILCCEGLDTLATVRVNGAVLAETDNMFRQYEWDVKDVLREGQNTIDVTFSSAVRFCEKAQRAHYTGSYLFPNKVYSAMSTWIRKEQCNFGWDWGVKLGTCGIWRKIRIVAFNTARLTDLHIIQKHDRADCVALAVSTEVEKTDRSVLSVRASVQLNGATVAEGGQILKGKNACLDLPIAKPQLWWPNNMGGQPLYDVTVEILDSDGIVLDVLTRRIGLRTLRLDRHADEWGECFQFVVNGQPFFAKGANWVPADAIQARMTPARYRAWVEAAAAANMNMLRVWGGGIYEDASFYEACDELGICVWQDFMFGHGSYYPLEHADFRRNVRDEAIDQVKRLRHHACLALWCGNNELEQGAVQKRATSPNQMSWKNYARVFDDLLPGIVAKLHPDCDYWPSSPHTPRGDRQNWNDPTCGDAHLWDVWHMGKPFEWYRTCDHRFNSEFGFQSLPEPKTVYAYTETKDRNITAYVMEQHQRSHGNGRIMEYLLEWFQAPNSFESTLWLSQILQGMSIKYACEHWRRMMPRGMGTLYWQLNDCWPVASWSSIDYHGRWKALHYMAKSFFAPLMVSGVEDVVKGSVDIHVTSDLMTPTPATVKWVVTDVDGKVLLEGERKVRMAKHTTRKVHTLALKSLAEVHEARGLLVWLELEADGHPTSRNLVFFVRPIKRPRIFSPRPRHLDLSWEPGIRMKLARQNDGSCEVTLTTQRPALWTWLDLEGVDAGFSDNFFHLRPGAARTVRIVPAENLSIKALRDRLVARSLVETYKTNS